MKCELCFNELSQNPHLYTTDPTNSYRETIIEFKTKSNIETESIVTLLEEMTPLFVYICSCLKYHGYRKFTHVSFNLKFNINSRLKLKNIINVRGQDLENPINEVTATKNLIKSRGFYYTFSEPFRIEIILVVVHDLELFDPDISYEEFTTEEEFTREREFNPEYEPEYEPDDEPDEEEDDEDEEEEEVINVTKTFKTEECVICIENGPNILFCNCGHLYICNNCLEFKKLSKYPVCKTENTILRIIE